MSSRMAPQRRRHRDSDSEDAEGEDDSGRPGSSGSGSGSSKRRRTGAFHGESSEDDSSNTRDARSQRRNGATTNASGFQPGAIVKVKVTNFVTYEDAVFHPGPNLNMVIGPNGTGKSSLVCAICLGLGFSAIHLGRATKFGEFVKYGKDQATIEIELERQPEDDVNYIVKVRITRDGDKRKWWINGDETNLKTVSNLMKKLGIQVDNLCQFLPQDRVAEFAALSPIELLHETQRAAAPPEMLAWHDELKVLRKEQKALQINHDSNEETLRTMEERQENLRSDVERLQERAAIQEKIKLLEKCVPFVEYREAGKKFNDAKGRKAAATRKLKDLETQVEPTMQAVNRKQEYHDQIHKVVEPLKKGVGEAERVAELAYAEIQEMETSIKGIDAKRNAEAETNKQQKSTRTSIQRKIAGLEAQLRNPPPVFDGASWNAKIRAKESRGREIESLLRNLRTQGQDIKQRGGFCRNEIQQATAELEALDSQQGQNLNKLRIASPDVAKVWEWVEKNQDKFQKQVYGPPLVECSVKDPRYVDHIESLLQKNDFTVITVQTVADSKTLIDQVTKVMKLRMINIRTMSTSLAQQISRSPPPIPREQLQDFGLDGYALDYINGPEPVLAMLVNAHQLHKAGIALKEVDSNKFQVLIDKSLNLFVTGRLHCRTIRRAEYGAAGISTITKTIGPGRHWTDQPVDVSFKRDLQEKLRHWQEEFDAEKVKMEAVNTEMEALKTEQRPINEEIKELKEQKDIEQKAAGMFAALPQKLEREKESLEQLERNEAERRQHAYQLILQQDEMAVKKCDLALKHKAQVEALRAAHSALLEARIRLIEAASDVDALKARNEGIAQQLEDERQALNRATREAVETKQAAKECLQVCQAILAQNEEHNDYFQSLDSELTLEQLMNDIDAEKSKLDYIHEGNPGALKEFQDRQVSIDKMIVKIRDSDRKLESFNRRITEVKEKWEPQLDKLIAEISTAFAYNFEQISCAGEVGVHKDEDFDLWSIEIRVKFRESEPLQLLDPHRQSGGERAVSTIFYLMSLQSLARAPFRVVDEINQGMDPRNERMVHERMVEIACKEHTSQYFLITPKLLTNLKYDARMKVLCIASGEYMPDDHSTLDISNVIQRKRMLNAAVAVK